MTVEIFRISFRVPFLQRSLQFLVRFFPFLSLILCYSYFGTFFFTWSVNYLWYVLEKHSSPLSTNVELGFFLILLRYWCENEHYLVLFTRNFKIHNFSVFPKIDSPPPSLYELDIKIVFKRIIIIIICLSCYSPIRTVTVYQNFAPISLWTNTVILHIWLIVQKDSWDSGSGHSFYLMMPSGVWVSR